MWRNYFLRFDFFHEIFFYRDEEFFFIKNRGWWTYNHKNEYEMNGILPHSLTNFCFITQINCFAYYFLCYHQAEPSQLVCIKRCLKFRLATNINYRDNIACKGPSIWKEKSVRGSMLKVSGSEGKVELFFILFFCGKTIGNAPCADAMNRHNQSTSQQLQKYQHTWMEAALVQFPYYLHKHPKRRIFFCIYNELLRVINGTHGKLHEKTFSGNQANITNITNNTADFFGLSEKKHWNLKEGKQNKIHLGLLAPRGKETRWGVFCGNSVFCCWDRLGWGSTPSSSSSVSSTASLLRFFGIASW